MVVLVKKGARRDIEKKVSELLAPYDQQLQVPEYEKVCYCVGSIARRRAYEAMDDKFGATESKEASEFGKETFELDPGKIPFRTRLPKLRRDGEIQDYLQSEW